MLGAVIGDIVGSRFEFNNIKTKDFDLFDSSCTVTDDSVMSVAVAQMCLNGYVPEEKEKIIETFKKWGQRYPDAGYGDRFLGWVLSDDPKPYNSCGNGSAMRVSAIGFWAKSEKEVEKYSSAVTEVTHNHPEGIKGAYVTAMCIFMARHGASKDEIRAFAKKHYDIDFDYEELRRTYIHGAEICQNTVPQAIFCFLISESFEDCLRTTISIGGDCDTTAAISCAIAEAYYGIPSNIAREALKFIPDDMKEVIIRFDRMTRDDGITIL
jgi:type I restriction enzyme M protein